MEKKRMDGKRKNKKVAGGLHLLQSWAALWVLTLQGPRSWPPQSLPVTAGTQSGVCRAPRANQTWSG